MVHFNRVKILHLCVLYHNLKRKLLKMIQLNVRCVRQWGGSQGRGSLLGRGPILHEGLREGFSGRVTFNQDLKVGVDKANT